MAQIELQAAWPMSQADLCHGSYQHGLRAPDLAEAIEQGQADMQLHHLALEGARVRPVA